MYYEGYYTKTREAARDKLPSLYDGFNEFSQNHIPELDRLSSQEGFNAFREPDIDVLEAALKNGDKVKIRLSATAAGIPLSGFEIQIGDTQEVFVINDRDTARVETREKVFKPGPIFQDKFVVIRLRPFEMPDVTELTDLLAELDDPATKVTHSRVNGVSLIKYAVQF